MKRFALALVASAALLFGVGAVAQAQYGSASATFDVPSAAPGGNVTITITGCTPGETLTVSVDGVVVGTTTCTGSAALSTGSILGIGLVQQAARDGHPFRPLKADADKVTRAGPISVMYENGKVWHARGASWLADFEAELMAFPNGTHDDQVDCAAYAGLHAARQRNLEVIWV